MKRKREWTNSEELYEKILRGDRIALSKAITLIESELESDQRLGLEILDRCMPHTGKAFRIGITGVPGVGKSTLIDSWGMYLIQQGHKLAILSIDPSSEKSKGSILGDKTRMNSLSKTHKAYIRPSPNRGMLGGISRKTRETMLLCEAAGFDIILVETVGVGQAENAIKNMVDLFLLLLLPNAGDELQGIKKGIVEMADIIAINKSDGPNIEQARQTQSSYSQALRLFHSPALSWKVPIILCSGLEGEGLDSLWEQAERFKKHLQESGNWESNRQTQMSSWVKEIIADFLHKSFYQHPVIVNALKDIPDLLAQQKLSPSQIARKLIALWKSANTTEGNIQE